MTIRTKRALVTGAGARIGQAIAVYLGQRGFDVAVHYASSDEGARITAGAIEAAGQKAALLQADLLSEEATQDLVPRAAEALGGPISVLVNNASIFEYDTVHSATRDSWDRHIGSNLRAPFVLTQALAAQVPEPLIDDRGEPLAQGLVINMLDQKINKLTPEHMTYTIAKMGLWAFTRTGAQGLAPNVRMNAIGPGPTLQGARQPDHHFAGQRSSTILQRGSNLDDITAAVGYLLDAPAVTGQCLSIDGGQHLIWQTPDEMGVS
ncbi:SDR family oxidoreductase [Ponticoccus sp. SC2-23]|uniref:SDR family oxidoreductase n=1 Tax=Alexandriicola marinus TaxID=2081710 RepID=UPI000FDAF708|nr:SDR family oxidoreductase [Alexandriicola marinus]MBM1220386.1 SDR family oxidoreductase [Ponticoccus sp. SC6-9]MBM1225072.1 SDR family oxidoreductase [Ponticoccus sp. SC6-15]MBM1228586.1 SDR family oxidoreductase [Ponticoccus sp. SC6-38]MBM1233777.1 SDR family oxidoreductase [Ponticoccus sp. SC6-45]MBM1239087.1 SDR family oxidoreductase [Ponticoccus sp. SC6-49]MBM1242869.1 SDR family oxidoreductase [Ponticoccus sp. SC2-64]MBM1247301.1 SDR family oxidoreductase [Ponticoccus sp. SC6-42]MB